MNGDARVSAWAEAFSIPPSCDEYRAGLQRPGALRVTHLLAAERRRSGSDPASRNRTTTPARQRSHPRRIEKDRAMNEHDDEIGTGGRVDPERWVLTGRAAIRGYRFGRGQDKPARSRCQRKTPKQRQYGPTGKALQRKQKRREKRVAAWLAAEHEWTQEAA